MKDLPSHGQSIALNHRVEWFKVVKSPSTGQVSSWPTILVHWRRPFVVFINAPTQIFFTLTLTQYLPVHTQRSQYCYIGLHRRIYSYANIHSSYWLMTIQFVFMFPQCNFLIERRLTPPNAGSPTLFANLDNETFLGCVSYRVTDKSRIHTNFILTFYLRIQVDSN